MGSVNHIQATFSLFILILILVGSLFNSFERFLPSFIRESFRYGKFAYEGEPTFAKSIQVPKSWFKHFYVYASMLSISALILTIMVYVFNFPVPPVIEDILNLAGGTDREAHVSSASVLLALALLTLQCLRRFYDTHYVSVYSKNGKMNLSHYMVGYIHYTGTVLAILVEAPKFAGNALYQSTFCWNDLSYLQFAAALLFIWSCWHQYNVTVILANLRKNSKGIVVTEKHRLPHGDWFNYVSSPHNLAEILMYVSLTIILWRNITMLYILAWVLCNQVETALLAHWWYQENFIDLPKERMAIIPFIY